MWAGRGTYFEWKSKNRILSNTAFEDGNEYKNQIFEDKDRNLWNIVFG